MRLEKPEGRLRAQMLEAGNGQNEPFVLLSQLMVIYGVEYFVYSWLVILGIGKLLGHFKNCKGGGGATGGGGGFIWALISCYYVCYLQSQALDVDTPSKRLTIPTPPQSAPFFFSLREYICSEPFTRTLGGGETP